MADEPLSAEDLTEKAMQRRSSQSARLEEYRRMLRPYFGPEEAAGPGPIQSSYADGRAAIKITPPAHGRGNDVLNLIPQIVDSIVAVRGITPIHSVLVENNEDSAREAQIKRTRGLRQQHKHSQMIVQGAQVAFYLASMGDGCFVLNPRTPKDIEDEKKRDGKTNPFLPIGVYIQAVNPANAFPEFRFGEAGNDLDDLFCMWTLEPEKIEETYGIEVEEATDVIHYYSRTEKRIVCGGKDVIPRVKHDLGFCPGVWVGNKANDGRHGQADIRMAVDINEQMGYVYKIYLNSLIWAVHPIIHIHERQYVSGDTTQIGPGATITTTNTGKVELLSPQGRPEAALSMLNTLMEGLHQVTGVSPIQSQGIIDRSNVSARSVDRQQAPMENRLMLSNLLLGAQYERLNAKILLMLTNLREFKGVEFSMYGQDKGGTFNETFTPDDIGGWTENKVKWDATLGTSRHETLAMVLQVFKESVLTGQPYRFPFRMVIEALGYEDAQAIMDEAVAEAKAAMAAMPAPPQPPGAPGPAAGAPPGGDATGAMQDASALQAGGMAAAGPPGGAGGGGPPPDAGPVQPPPSGPIDAGAGAAGMPPFPPVGAAPSQSGMGTPAPVPDIGQLVQSATASLRLHGEIAAYHGIPDGVHIDVTDHRDVAQVRTAVQQAAPGMKVEVKVLSPAAKNGSK